jgi:DMSO/TMAO reductase YedYZ molybdopterin-dependent catalytic subunit
MPDSEREKANMTKRKFLKASIRFIAGIALFNSPLFSWVRPAHAKIQKMILPRNFPRKDLIDKNPANLDTRYLNITPLDDFKTMGITNYRANLNTWRLSIEGRVERPLVLTYSQILTLPAIERNVLLICPGFFANNGRWKGISLIPLLQKAKIQHDATLVAFSGPEGTYEKTESFYLKDVLSNQIFLAYGVNGKPLPIRHGFPLRVVAEGHYGFNWIKYVYKVSVN